jgi:hypothetical protein
MTSFLSNFELHSSLDASGGFGLIPVSHRIFSIDLFGWHSGTVCA